MAKCRKRELHYASIESLYRSKIGAYLKKGLGAEMLNIYIDAPLEVRAKREFKNQTIDNGENYTFDEIVKRTKKKDQFKINHWALRVKEIVDIIVNNDKFVENEQDYQNILTVLASIVKK